MRNKAQPANTIPETVDLISPKELAQRWRCSRSSVDRIARRAAFTRFVLGEGRNGMVRYVRREVEEFEVSRRVQMN
jgi:hypothetical protein